jgi:hypothetical protein
LARRGRQRRGQTRCGCRSSRSAWTSAGDARARPGLRPRRVVGLPAPGVRLQGLADRPLFEDPPKNFRAIRDGPGRAGTRSSPSARGPLAAVRRGLLRCAAVSIDSFIYYGTDDRYLNYLARFLKTGAQVGIAGAGLTAEIEGPVPEHLRAWWEPGMSCLHSAAWWRRHWERSALVDVETADDMPDGWRRWLDWHRSVCPDNALEIAAVEADAGRILGYVRAVARLRPDARIEEPIASIPTEYRAAPLLRVSA